MLSDLTEHEWLMDRSHVFHLASELCCEVSEWLRVLDGERGQIFVFIGLVGGRRAALRKPSSSTGCTLQCAKLWGLGLCRLKFGPESLIADIFDCSDTFMEVSNERLSSGKLLTCSNVLTTSISAYLVCFRLRDASIVENSLLDVLLLVGVHQGDVQN